jgi:hypothetical protein
MINVDYINNLSKIEIDELIIYLHNLKENELNINIDVGKKTCIKCGNKYDPDSEWFVFSKRSSWKGYTPIHSNICIECYLKTQAKKGLLQTISASKSTKNVEYDKIKELIEDKNFIEIKFMLLKISSILFYKYNIDVEGIQTLRTEGSIWEKYINLKK